MSQNLYLSTTGTLSPVVLEDLGAREFVHPTVDVDLLVECSFERLRDSASLAAALAAGYITLKNESGAAILSMDELVKSIRKDNPTAVVDPTAGDDIADGYDVGSTWLNTVTGTAFVCISAAAGAAVWCSPLKRTAGDFALFTEKASPVAADVILLEDSEDGGKKKRSTVGASGGGGGGAATTATAVDDITTTSLVDVLATGMTLTPAAGNYLVLFSGSFQHSVNAALMEANIWAAGAKVAASAERYQSSNVNRAVPFCCVAKVTVNGAQAIEGRWRVNQNTGTMHERTLLILKVA